MGRAFLSAPYYAPPTTTPPKYQTWNRNWNAFDPDDPTYYSQDPVYEAFVSSDAVQPSGEAVMHESSETESDSGASSARSDDADARLDVLSLLERRAFADVFTDDAAEPPAPRPTDDAPVVDPVPVTQPQSTSFGDAHGRTSTADASRRLSTQLATISALFDNRAVARRFSRPHHTSDDDARGALLASLAHHAPLVAAARV